MTHKRQHKPIDRQVTSENPDPQQLHEAIACLAYQFYCQCGYEHGHDLEHWIEAERQILERDQRDRTVRE